MEPQLRFKEKSVIIHRDENGFGFRVGGQNPVYVDCVHENGAAWKAGVRKDDRIIKVNGTLVRSYDHQRVVQMIQNCIQFVNLTLHSPETVLSEPFTVVSGGLQSTETNNESGLHHVGTTNNISNNLVSNSMQVHSLHQRLHHPHPHSISSNLNWLLEIGDDLFQDNHYQKQQSVQQQQQQINSDIITVSPNRQTGVSKLIVSGPSRLVTSHSNVSRKLDTRHNRSQSNTRDNPYYYYKTAPDKVPDTSSCNSTTSSTLLVQDQPTSRATTSLSMVRSRSSSKMSTRSSSSKMKARNLRSRIVDDLRSLTITNSQTTPSSLSTSPSSSDLSDCDHQDSSLLDCLTLNSSTMSTGSAGGQSSNNTLQSTQATRPKNTTRRLEIIRELIDTEKTHTEKLKQLNDLLYKPIKAEGLVPPEQLKMVFSCHKTLLKIHRQIYKKLAAAQLNVAEPHQEPLIGKALVDIFDGELGKRLEKAASSFCACQSTNTELLNRVTRKDTKAGEFLAQVANQQMLGRLGIKDLLASCFQRLTKYPLLLDNLLKATPAQINVGGIHCKSLSEGSIALSLNSTAKPLICDAPCGNDNIFESNEETLVSKSLVADNNNDEQPTVPSLLNSSATSQFDDISTTSSTATQQLATTSLSSMNEDYAYERLCIEKALNLSRQILIHVNEAVNRAIAQDRLRQIWRKTDKHPTLSGIDIETQNLLHEGPLTLRLARRSFEVYVLLLTHYLVILTREGQDKYKLRFFTADGKPQNSLSPIFNIDEHLATRDTATDENGFYLLCKLKDFSRIYEFASQSPTERAKWKEKIHMAQLYNFAAVPDDDNTLTRYTELISINSNIDGDDSVAGKTQASLGGASDCKQGSSPAGSDQPESNRLVVTTSIENRAPSRVA